MTKLCCRDKFIGKIRQFHEDTQLKCLDDGDATAAIPVNNDVNKDVCGAVLCPAWCSGPRCPMPQGGR